MEKLKKLREEKNLSYNAMAKLLEINKTFYWQIEHGDRRLSYNMAYNIARIFNLKPDDIFYEYFKENITKKDC